MERISIKEQKNRDDASVIRAELSKLSNLQIKQEVERMNIQKDDNTLRLSLFQMELKTREIREKFLQNRKVKVF